MRQLVLVAPLLGACNQLLGLDPTSLAVDAATIDAAPDASVCPSQGQLGFVDEDGDTIDDRCDRCPSVADDQADSDGDGVGDACDVTATPTRIAFFDGFHDGELTGWVVVGVENWTESDDHAVLGSGNAISVLVADIPAIAHGRVVTSIEVTGLPTATDHVIGAAFSGADLSAYTCVADESGTTTSAAAYIHEEQAGSRSVVTGPNGLLGAFQLGAVMVTDARWNTAAQTCNFDLGGEVSLMGADPDLPAGSAGIYSQSVLVRVPYVVIYEEL